MEWMTGRDGVNKEVMDQMSRSGIDEELRECMRK